MSDPSLIQQRRALQRNRWWRVYGIVVALIAMGFAISLIFTGTLPWLYAITALIFATSAVISVVRLREARRDIHAFEELYGADAGRQD